MKLFGNGKRVAALLFSSLFAITILIGISTVANSESKTGTAAPDFSLKDLNGTTVTLGQFKGQKPVLLYFWATWCHYCQAARPAVIDLRKATPQADIEIIAIDVGAGDSLAKLKRFEESDPAPYTVLYDTDSKVTRSYSIEGIPHFILVDKTGTIKYTGNQLPSDPVKLLSSEGQK
jgi:peroxiredoxin